MCLEMFLLMMLPKKLPPEVLVLHGPDRPLGRLGVELKLERLVVADLLLVGCHVHS